MSFPPENRIVKKSGKAVRLYDESKMVFRSSIRSKSNKKQTKIKLNF